MLSQHGRGMRGGYHLLLHVSFGRTELHARTCARLPVHTYRSDKLTFELEPRTAPGGGGTVNGRRSYYTASTDPHLVLPSVLPFPPSRTSASLARPSLLNFLVLVSFSHTLNCSILDSIRRRTSSRIVLSLMSLLCSQPLIESRCRC